MRKIFLIFILFLTTESGYPQPNPLIETSNRIFQLISENKLAEINAYGDTGFYGKTLAYRVNTTLESTLLETGKPEKTWKTEVDTQGCKTVVAQWFKTANGSFIYNFKFNKHHRLESILVDTVEKDQVTAFYKTPETYQTKTYYRKGIRFQTQANSWLGGDLFLPRQTTKPPLVILVHGSGPHDRNGSVNRNKIYLDLAQQLAQQGVATLIYDKITYTYQYDMPIQFDSLSYMEETILDAINAVKYAKGTTEIDTASIFIAGHSQGGMCAPKMAEICAGIKGLILLAAPARRLLDILPEQLKYIYGLDGVYSEEETQEINAINFQIANALKPDLTTKTRVLLPFGLKAKYWLYDRNYNAVETARRIRQPLLIIQGKRDYNVTMTDFEIWEKELKGPKTAFKLFEDLDHSFFKGNEKAKPEDIIKPNHLDSRVAETIADWVKKCK